MRVLGCVDRPDGRPAAQALARRGIELATIDEVVAAADFLTVHVPLTDATRNLIDAGRLAQMKPGSFLVNIARGGVVDEAALREALTTARGCAARRSTCTGAKGRGRARRSPTCRTSS